MFPALLNRGPTLITSLVLGIFLIHTFPWGCIASAEPVTPESESIPSDPWYTDIEAEWGGQIRFRASTSWPDDESFFRLVGTDSYEDGSAEFRLKNKLFFGNWGYFETHYEAVLAAGDTRERTQQLTELFPAFFEDSVLLAGPIDDDRRLLDLTTTLTDTDLHILYNRLDRLSLTLLPEWGTVRIGRQVITWGNGLLFNPMDLFNPFAPTDIERDYKVGDDMVTTQFPVRQFGDFQFLYVPRRDPESRDVEWNESSLAGKFHFAAGTTEFDLMGARHFEDHVVGIGGMGYLWDAAWRMDATWTFLDENSDNDDYLSFVANIDYSWVWWQKNFYGLIEFYYNGLGEEDYIEALLDPDIVERLDRGELFVLGRSYLSGQLQMEVHPLVNVFFGVINNLDDPSGVIQPRLVWNVAEDFDLTVGANILYGEEGTEFGGIEIPFTDLLIKGSDSAFIWLTYYF